MAVPTNAASSKANTGGHPQRGVPVSDRSRTGGRASGNELGGRGRRPPASQREEDEAAADQDESGNQLLDDFRARPRQVALALDGFDDGIDHVGRFVGRCGNRDHDFGIAGHLSIGARAGRGLGRDGSTTTRPW